MTKKQYNDETLYQEIMASLEPGAAEYDRLMASGEAPAKRNKVSSIVWYAAAAAVVGLLVVTATLFVGNDNAGQKVASTDTVIPKDRYLAIGQAQKAEKENTDSDLHRLTAKIEPVQEQQPLYPTPQKRIYTAMLPEVDFCPEESDDAMRSNAVSSDNVRLPQVSKERSFNLVCKVVLPEIIACADSTIYQSTGMMVACDEIEYNDNPFKNVSL